MYQTPNGEDAKIAASTLERWYYSYKKKGFEALMPVRRCDTGRLRKLDSDIAEQIKYLKVDGKKKRVYIIALINDASRYITGIDVFFNDNFVNLMSVLKSAVARLGKPKILNFDNGASYKNKQMELLAARIGTTISYCAPYTPQSKAKIERWFRTLKDLVINKLKLLFYLNMKGVCLPIT